MVQPHDEDPYWDTIGKSRAELEAECDSTDASVATVLVRIIVLLGLVCLFVWCSNAQAQSGGDANGDGAVTISDVVDLVRYIFEGVELPRTEWVEVDTTVSVVWILDRPFTVADYPIRVQKHYYVTTQAKIDTIRMLGFPGENVVIIDTTINVDTTAIREYIFHDATYQSGNQLIRTMLVE